MLNALWYNKNKFKFKWYFYPLIIFSFLYRIIIFIRKLLCKLKIKSTTYFSVPVIIVGNITAGGTGKTPVVVWLVEKLKKHGFSPGVVSRGYGGKSQHWPQIVTTESLACEVGDEALLIFKRTNCPVVVDPKRVRAVRKLLDVFNCDVVISDDGLQHFSLGRDIEIVVVDGERRLGNGFCLPAGPLREPESRLKSVDFVICNGKACDTEIAMQLISGDIISLCDKNKTLSFDSLKNKKIHAVAAIGNPERFFNSLEKKGLSIIRHSFRDHYFYTISDFNFLQPDEIVIMTEKDAVKCGVFADERFFYIPVSAEIQDDAFSNILLAKLKLL